MALGQAGGLMAGRDELCVVHLVRIGEAVESLQRFAGSHSAHPAGADHRLVILYKGFDRSEAALAPYREAVADLPHTELEVSDQGFDLTAYRSSAELLQAGRYCFMNSHSEILADGWLAMLEQGLNRPGVGIAGATGSWASHSSLARFLVRLPGPYSGLFDRSSAGAILRSLEQGGDLAQSGGAPASAPGGPARRVLEGLGNLPHTLHVMLSFDPFPAHHLRTNAFLIGHESLMRLSGFELKTKLDAHRLESGRASVTRQLGARGLRAVVVDRHGNSHEPEQWASSETFWQRGQGGLLVADNQTRSFQHGDPDRRLFLSRYAWGDQADPS
ncbi:MAG: hypothetical protein ACLQBB_14120 [Solirubrobacteraceae bacterium]